MQLMRLDVISRTIYNVSSADYEKDKIEFEILLAQAIKAVEKSYNVNYGITTQKPVNNGITHQSIKQAKQAETTTTTIASAVSIASSKCPQNELLPHQKYDSLIAATAEKYKIDPALLKGVIKAESNFNETARSREGALGLVQLMPSTARSLGVNPLNPKEAIEGGAKYLSQMLNRYDGNQNMALAAYNAGPGNVDRYGGVPPFRETVHYIKKVTQNAIDYRDDFKYPVT